ncbi:hypothetical protein TELCIR_01579 [Teladorsagia circumcincta]|uniref:Geminin n=1 Tax=Teladorsagia circumcincta TaxID=45464 RepID=A0A2G9V1J0_TELCI|nr:hypothetical protein TELCIR_01579 [Teladorsagia circumcincta]
MASIRVGLKQFSNSSTNSPSLKVLNAKKANVVHNLTPVTEKNEIKRKVTPAVIIEGKENQETQATVVVKATHVQTDVTTVEKSPPITKEDLLCEEPTSSYWRVMAERLEKEIDIELETSFNKSLELDKSYEELEESRNRLKVLTDVMEDVLDEVRDNEIEEGNKSESE